MRLVHYVAPRDCGKTTHAIEYLKRTPTNHLFVKDKTVLKDLVDEREYERIHNIGGSFRGIDRMVSATVDEHLLRLHGDGVSIEKYKKWFSELACNMKEISEIVLYSTPARRYRVDAYYAFLHKASNEYLAEYANLLQRFGAGDWGNKFANDFAAMEYTYLAPSSPNIEVVVTNFNRPKTKEENDKFFTELVTGSGNVNEEIYYTQIKGEFLKVE